MPPSLQVPYFPANFMLSALTKNIRKTCWIRLRFSFCSLQTSQYTQGTGSSVSYLIILMCFFWWALTHVEGKCMHDIPNKNHSGKHWAGHRLNWQQTWRGGNTRTYFSGFVLKRKQWSCLLRKKAAQQQTWHLWHIWITLTWCLLI